MLVLSRRPGEAIRIGSELRVVVVSVSGSQVRLAIDAPDDVAVHRDEVFERIALANREASRARPDQLAALGALVSSPPAEGDAPRE